jgi:hypothetical protein
MLAPLSQPGYLATARQLGLMRPLPGLPSQVGRLPNFERQGTVRDLAVTPLHLARVIAALELAGRLPTPTLAAAEAGLSPQSAQAFSPDTARYIRSLLPQVEEQIVGFAGQATPKETGRRSLSWFAGLAPAEAIKAEAKAEAALVLDPGKIAPATPAAQGTWIPAKYVVVTVVVTDTPENNPALQLARAPVNVLLRK